MRFRKCSSCVTRCNKQQRSSKHQLRTHCPAVHHTNNESSNDHSALTGRNQSPRYQCKPRYATMIKQHGCASFTVNRFLEPFMRSVREWTSDKRDYTRSRLGTESDCVRTYSVHCHVIADNKSQFLSYTHNTNTHKNTHKNLTKQTYTHIYTHFSHVHIYIHTCKHIYIRHTYTYTHFHEHIRIRIHTCYHESSRTRPKLESLD